VLACMVVMQGDRKNPLIFLFIESFCSVDKNVPNNQS